MRFFFVGCDVLIRLFGNKLSELIIVGWFSYSIRGRCIVYLFNVLWRWISWRRSVEVVIWVSLRIIGSIIILKRVLIGLLNSISCGVRCRSFCWCYVSCFVRCLIWIIIIYCLVRLNNGRICDSFIRIFIWICGLSKSRYIRDVVFMGFFLRYISRISCSFICCVYCWVFYSLYYGIFILGCCLRIYIFCDLCYFCFLYNIFCGFILLYFRLWSRNNMRIWALVIIVSSICSVLFR